MPSFLPILKQTHWAASPGQEGGDRGAGRTCGGLWTVSLTLYCDIDAEHAPGTYVRYNSSYRHVARRRHRAWPVS
jgi:hypothetical protein